jgi:hypothetical protein
MIRAHFTLPCLYLAQKKIVHRLNVPALLITLWVQRCRICAHLKYIVAAYKNNEKRVPHLALFKFTPRLSLFHLHTASQSVSRPNTHTPFDLNLMTLISTLMWQFLEKQSAVCFSLNLCTFGANFAQTTPFLSRQIHRLVS